MKKILCTALAACILLGGVLALPAFAETPAAIPADHEPRVLNELSGNAAFMRNLKAMLTKTATPFRVKSAKTKSPADAVGAAPAEGAVATLQLCTSFHPSEAPVNVDGHAFFIVTNVSDADLDVGGLLIAAIYRLTKMENKNTNAIIDAIHFGDKVPLLLVPAIYLSTVITHLFGGSAGREGAALQIGGSLGCYIGRLFHLDEKDMRIATLCGMSAVFSALFGTPLTATIFALEVISVGVFYYSALVPCIVASLAALAIANAFGIAPTQFTFAFAAAPKLLLLRVAALAAVCSLMSILFCVTMHGTERLFSSRIPNTWLRIAAGGGIVIVLSLLVGTGDYNGAGMDVITRAIEGGQAAPDAFFWKLLFTAVTIGSGFKGGEVVPTFFIGATLGCVLGSLLGIPTGFAAALGLVCVFCGAVNCPIASVILSIELFGAGQLVYFALACGVAYMLSGYFGLYSSQKILYSKLRTEFINIHAK